MVSRGGAGPSGSGWSVSAPAFCRERSSRRAPCEAVRLRRHFAFVGHGTGFRRGRRVGRSRPLFGPSLFPVAAGGGGSGGGEAGEEPFPLEGPDEPSACWEREGGFWGRWGEERSWGLQIPLRGGRGPSMPRPLPQLLQAVISFACHSYFPWTQESGHPDPQLPRQEWRQKTKASASFQVMDRSSSFQPFFPHRPKSSGSQSPSPPGLKSLGS